MDLNVTVHILRLNCHQQRPKPLKRAKVPAHPEEIYLAQSRLGLGVVESVPDAFEDRGKGCDADTGTHEYSDLIFEHVFRGAAKGAVDVHARQYVADVR